MASVEDPSKKDLDLQKHLTSGKNPRGIPSVIFIDNVEHFLGQLGNVPVETALGAFSELYSKYKFMEGQLTRTKQSTKAKIPEIEKTLALVRFLKEKQDGGEETVTTHYSLCDTVYAKAKVECNGTVCLWLGANVMLEYTYDEALEVLQTSLNNATEKMKSTNEDLAHLRSQSITVEVNMARLFNHDVKRKKLLQLKQEFKATKEESK